MTRPTAVVTGAGSGIGAAIAAHFASDHDLILTHLRDDDELRETQRACRHAGARVATVIGDLTVSTTLDELDHQIESHADRLQAAVSNAGAYPRVPWHELELDLFREHVELNLVTHAALARLVTPAMTARGHGSIVTISSVLTQLGRVDLAGYIAAKSGLEGLVRALARELGPHDITVNCVRAGSIAVPTEHAVVDDHSAMVRRQLDRQCLPRRGQPTDIAAAVAFLCSAQAAFITGQCLTVDGGWCLT